MCADFRVKCEVEVRGLTPSFFMPHAEGMPYLRFLAGGHLRKAPGNIAESAVLPYPLFPCGAKYHGIHHALRRSTAAPLLRAGREGRRAGRVRTKRADNVEVPKLLRTFAMIETYGN